MEIQERWRGQSRTDEEWKQTSVYQFGQRRIERAMTRDGIRAIRERKNRTWLFCGLRFGVSSGVRNLLRNKCMPKYTGETAPRHLWNLYLTATASWRGYLWTPKHHHPVYFSPSCCHVWGERRSTVRTSGRLKPQWQTRPGLAEAGSLSAKEYI
jgi:hypothetical protein